MRMMNILTALSGALLLAACANVPLQSATLVSTKNGREQYAVSGSALYQKSCKDCTKPYLEKSMSEICPNGLRYLEFMEEGGTTNLIPWMSWKGMVECK